MASSCPQRQILQAARALLADIVVMRRLAADDAAQRDIAVEARPEPRDAAATAKRIAAGISNAPGTVTRS